jgi:integrase/recombinase XerD
MSALAPTLEAFFTERLITQRRASPHTIAAYRDTVCLLLEFVQQQTGKGPATLQFEDLDAQMIGRFLDHLERKRANSVRTRNARLSAIRSFYRFAILRHPEHAELMGRILAIPPKRFERVIVTFLVEKEVEAILAAPERKTFLGRRDHALLLLAIQTGLRVSELTLLTCGDIALGTGAHVCCLGKGRKERAVPLTSTTGAVIGAWLKERTGVPTDPLFCTRQGTVLSRWAVSLLVSRHAGTAAQRCPSLATKKISPHVLRHTAAMRLLHAGVDTSVIALWLGHESVETTQMYVHADLTLKERALARTSPMGRLPGRYRPTDRLLAFLEAL